MAEGPVQVVLNPDRFREARISSRPAGTGKDFYEGRNEEFAAHKASILGALRAILLRNRGERLINVTVQMRPDALAKSHRPFSSLFTQGRAAHIGTGEYGELVFAVDDPKLRKILEAVEGAEIEVESREIRGGERKPWPSRRRCEVGAIESVRRWDAADERRFSLEVAEDWLGTEGSGGLSVDLFDLPTRSDLRMVAARSVEEVRRATAQAGRLVRVEGRDSRFVTRLKPGPPAPGSQEFRPSDLRSLLSVIETNPVVKRVRLDDRIGSEVPDDSPLEGDIYSAPVQPYAPGNRPVVGVIDGGVGGAVSNSAWLAGRSGLLAPEHRGVLRVDHGTQIASIIALGSALNPGLLDPNEDCRVYDLDLFPDSSFRDYYYGSLGDYLSEMRASVARAKSAFGVRIFNLSYNLERAPGGTPYSIAASGLDQIALDLDVIFVVSAGNLPAIEERSEWPLNPAAVLAMLAATTTDDGLAAPAESLSNVSVGAVNPLGLFGQLEHVPTTYTRRGVQVPSARKPDFAATGGATPVTGDFETGLRALRASTGRNGPVRGTSYAAPIVARYLATLDHAIAGSASRELLIALSAHHAVVPAPLRPAPLRAISTSFVGYGMVPSVADTLDGSPHRMTVVLSDVVLPGRRVEFPFTWPESLTSALGSCRGNVRLTLATEPVLDPAHGWELVRVNLDASVKQAEADGKFKRRSAPTHEFFSGYRFANERTLSSELGKWYPVKSFDRSMLRGVGRSSDWRLEIDYLTRANEGPPEQGVRFALVMTIEDPDGRAPVFDDMRASLTSIGVSLSDLRTAVPVGVRV